MPTVTPYRLILEEYRHVPHSESGSIRSWRKTKKRIEILEIGSTDDPLALRAKDFEGPLRRARTRLRRDRHRGFERDATYRCVLAINAGPGWSLLREFSMPSPQAAESDDWFLGFKLIAGPEEAQLEQASRVLLTRPTVTLLLTVEGSWGASQEGDLFEISELAPTDPVYNASNHPAWHRWLFAGVCLHFDQQRFQGVGAEVKGEFRPLDRQGHLEFLI